jgi:hypothetical protein
MQKAVFELLDLIYGELDVEEDRIQGKIVYRFISYEDLDLSLLYYPGNQEVVTRENFPNDFNSYIPMYEDEVKLYYEKWLKDRFSDKVRVKGVKFISFI